MVQVRRQQPEPAWAGKTYLGFCLTVLLTYGLMSLSWAQQAQLVDGIAAVVNNDIITISEVQEAMALETEQLRQTYAGSSLQQRLQTLYQQTLQNLTNIQLQLARARQLQLQVSEEEVDRQIEALKTQNQISEAQLEQMLKSRGMTLEAYRKQVREGLLVAKVVNAEVRSRLIILDSELREAYEERLDQYRVAGTQTISHILFLVPQLATSEEEEQIRQKAVAVLQQLQTGGDFAALAQQYSEGPSAERGGLLGTFQPGELLPGFEEAVAALEPGEMSPVVRTQVGWHIIRLEARQVGRYQPFEAVKEELKTALLREKTDSKYQEWLEALRQQAYIKILYDG